MSEHYRSPPPSTHLDALMIILAAAAMAALAVWTLVIAVKWMLA